MNFKTMLNNSEIKFSTSEENGLKQLKENDINIFCPGISTRGVAEIRMIQENPKRRIIATTIDKNGFEETKKTIDNLKLNNNIEVKLEDIRDKTSYEDNYFDFIYARLIMHYLSDSDFDKVLKELYRILKKGGRFFIVVRSAEDWEANLEGITYDKETGFTTYPVFDSNMKNLNKTATRRFHSENSLKNLLTKNNFNIVYSKKYKEQIYHGFMRTEKVAKLTSILEVMIEK